MMNNEMLKANATSDTTTNTSSVSTKTQCKDTGSVWTRKCPSCDKPLAYSDKYKLARAIQQNSKCVKCCNKHPIDTNIYYRTCPVCKDRIHYIKKSRFIAAEKRNSKCKSCAMSIAAKGRIPNEQARINMSKAQTGRKHSDETKKKMSGDNNGMFGIFRCGDKNPFYGKKHDEETRKRMRISALKRVSENGSGANIGKKENCYFFALEKEKNWDGIFHGKSGKQFIVWELGYSIDYYEPNFNIVVEYDEPKHYRCGILKSKDVERMNIIKSHLGCRFFRYNEKSGKLLEY